MAYSEIHWTQRQTRKPVSISSYFDKLTKKIKHDAMSVAKDKAYSMQHILTHRQRLKGGYGQFPLWNGANATPKSTKPSKNSYRGWRVERKGAGVYTIANYTVNNEAGAWQGYSYVKNLANGTGWNAATKRSPFVGSGGSLLVRKGQKIFSKQMPQGLAPWLRLKREELKKDILKVIKEGGIK
tara:strand:- start:13066 stop:13614 length:549 start_codon:yes stop_codon:yes gene_type:complete